ncbi:glycosyltransferase family 2 protein [Pseudolysinimonas sp.]|uniref:glycosyltransferase n=1 Tax=Pseudolysinimonas sp. TaxID=2680009 RepID=UPI00286B59F1|nr:glycosyltransferase family 2 protein [Pseudolysinimonas sp.]
MTGGPTVSIVIPAYNEERTIRACVVAAIEQTVPADEIIVVNNKSTDSTAAMLQALQTEFPDAPLIIIDQNEEQGITPTRNAGFNAATSDVIGRIDSDSILEPEWVAVVKRIFSDETVGAATGPMIYYDMPLRRFGARADDNMRRALLKLTKEYHFVFGSNMAIRGSAWRDIRDHVCNDADKEMHEDVDLGIHLFDRGHRIVYGSKMVSGMSARRLDANPMDYLRYVRRWEKTYDHHKIFNPALRAPMVVFSAVYPLGKLMRQQYLKSLKGGGVGPSAWAG